MGCGQLIDFTDDSPSHEEAQCQGIFGFGLRSVFEISRAMAMCRGAGGMILDIIGEVQS